MDTAIKKTRERLPPLNALRAFEAAARNLSFKMAAEELSVSQSAISHQVKGLEDYLGFRLFNRGTRSVELTRRGKMYYPVLRNAFDTIAEGTAVVQEKNLAHVLTLQVYSTFTIRWLLPRLANFQAASPEIQVRLTTAQSDVDFEHDDVDAAIMIGQPDNPSLNYTYLFDAELFPVCSPQYLEKLRSQEQGGKPLSPGCLSPQQILQVYPSPDDWREWLHAQGVSDLRTSEGLQLESYDIALKSAAQGMGIALGQQPYVADDLAQGLLTELFPGLRVRNPRRWFFTCREEKSEQPRIKVFRRWLLEQVATDPKLLIDHGRSTE
jgi:LysR family glycine cleavage system transcriptional activator